MTTPNSFRHLDILLIFLCLFAPNSGSVQKRQVVECPPLFDPNNGAVTEPRFPDPSQPGDVATFTCNTDYLLKGSTTLTCLAIGDWDGADPTCNRLCPGLPDPPNGTVTELANPSSAGDDAIYSCNQYYHLQGTFFRTCQADGTWDDIEPVCARECDFLVDPINGNVNEPNFPTTTGQTASYTCNAPYALVGGVVRTCQDDGNWDGQDRRCILAHCPVPQDPSNGNVFIPVGDIVVGTIVLFYCTDNYSLKGTRTITCQTDATWNANEPTCARECLDLYNPTNGQVAVSNTPTTSGDTATYSCNTNYVLVGDTTRTCQTDGTWTSQDPTCLRECPSLTNPDNGNVNVPNTPSRSGDSATYSCSSSYVLVGDTTRTCGDDGNWSNSAPTCVRECSTLSAPTNGQITSPNNPTRSGDVVTFSCNENYLLQGNQNRTCQSDGTYTGNQPTCARVCPDITGTALTVTGSTSPYIEGNIVTLSCTSPYTINGATTLTCESTGSWSSTIPSCRIECSTLSSPGNGNINQNNPSLVGAIALYSCDENHSLIGLAQRTCQSNGQWSGTPPKCSRECPLLLSPSNGQVVLASYPSTVGQLANYTCNTNYILLGNTPRICQDNGTWSGEAPTCVRECPGLTNPDNGNVNVPNTPSRSGDTATYSCSSGYVLVGDTTRTCGDDGNWSNSAPSCVRECSTLTAPTNGQVTSPNNPTQSGDVVTFSCNENYLLQGNQNRTCQSDGTYTGNQPTCARVCPDITGTALTVTGSTSPYIEGNIVTLSCTSPYTLNGGTTLTCGSTGSWSGTIPTCGIECSTLSSPANGNINQNNPSLVGAIALYSCDENHSLIGLAQRTCQSNGQWSGTPPTCARECPLLLTPSNGQVALASYPSTVGQLANYTCNTNYILQGNTQRNCQDNGTWSDEAPTCVRECPGLTNPDNGNVNVPNTPSRSGDTATYSCSSGYVLVGDTTRTCGDDGNWSNSAPSCVRECSTLTAPTNGQVTSPNNLTRSGDVVSFSCNENYLLQGNQNRTCQSDGTYTGNQATCARVCPDITGTALTVTGSTSPYIEGNIVTLSCTSPYTINGATTLTCENTGSWSGTIPTCQIECSPLSSPTDGSLTVNNPSLFGDIAAYSCPENYSLIGLAQRVCQSDGRWSGTPPTCVKECPQLQAPCNGEVVIGACPNTVGQSANYTCNTNYTLQGNPTRVCQDNGTWSGEAPTCVRECTGLSNPNNGLVTTPNNPSTQGDEATYSCLTNYSLVGNVNRTCLETGVWSGEQPTCLRECSTLTDPSNGQVTSPNNPRRSGDVVTFSCNENYLLQGNQNRTCQSNGTYTGNQPTCARVCPEITGTALTVTGSTSPYIEGNIVSLSCTSPYTINGASTLTCENTGSWSQTIPNCRIECSLLFSQANGNVSLNNPSVVGDIALYNCDENYSLIGQAQRTCQPNGHWSGTTPTCARACAVLPTPSNGQVTVGSCPSVRGQSASYSCNTNYILQGYTSRICQDNGTWSGEAPTCVRVCPSLTNPVNGEVNTPNNPSIEGDEATYSCSTNYSLAGNVNRTCLETGVWSGEQPTCLRECSTLTVPTNGQVTSPNNPTRSGDVVTFSCNENYLLQGNQNRTCQSDGTYTGNQPTCARVCQDITGTSLIVTGSTSPYIEGVIVNLSCTSPNTITGPTTLTCGSTGSWSDDIPTCGTACSSLSSPVNGNISLNNPSLVGDLALYNCDENYSLIGLAQRTCQSNGQWSGTSPTCVRECASLLAPSNGQVSVQSCPSSVGQVANYTCNTNYILQGNETRVCQDNGTWSGEAPTCFRECPGLSNPTNGEVNTPNNNSIEGDEATYSCLTNYSLLGNVNRTCLETGVWSGEQPTCLRECSTLTAPTNGQISSPNNPTRSGDVVTFSCNENYLLQGNQNRTCQSDGTYTGNQPTCVRVCPDIIGTALTVTGSTSPYIEGNIVTLSCTSPYTINGATTLTCENTGSWSGTIPICWIECSSLSSPANGNVTMNNPSAVGDIAVYNCSENYSLIGLSQRTCQPDGQWSGRPPTCARECPLLLSPSNGQVTVENCPSISGHSASYSCNTNYILQGNTQRVCQDNGTWSGEAPTCVRACPSIFVSHMTVIGLKSTYVEGDQVTLSCIDPYSLHGVNSLTCLSNGSWSESIPTCQMECGSLSNLANGQISLLNNESSVGQAAFYSCDDNYHLIGDSLRFCLTNGTWSSEAPSCIRECYSIFSPQHGQVSLSSDQNVAGTTAYYTCNEDYLLQGNLSRVCQDDGQWSGNTPSCVRECPSLSHPSNGNVTLNVQSVVGDLANYTCYENFTLYGESTRLCQVDGQWSNAAPTCVIECPVLTSPMNGQVSAPPTPNTVGDIANYTCNCQNVLQGNETRICMDSGQWSDVPPTCVRGCPTLMSPINGSVITPRNGTSFVGDVATYLCDENFILDNNQTRTCHDNGTWTGNAPNCIAVCPDLSNPVNGTVTISDGPSTVGHLAVYTCNENLILTGVNIRTCLQNGSWSGEQPTCVPVLAVCPELQNPVNGTVSTNGTNTLGDVAVYTCNEGFVLQGDQNRTCQNNGQWNGSSPSCVRVCPALGDPLNGEVTAASTINTVGLVVTYTCNDNFTLNGTQTMTCQSDGQWSGQTPTCVRVCPDLSSPVNGELIAGTGPHTIGQVVNYTCSLNYVLQGNPSRTCLEDGQWSGVDAVCVSVLIPVCVAAQVTGDMMNGTDDQIMNTFNSTYFGGSSSLAGVPIQSMNVTHNSATTTMSVCLEITSMNSQLITNIGNGFTLIIESGNNTNITTIGDPELVMVEQNYSVIIDSRCFWYKYINECVDMGLCVQRGNQVLCKCEETACSIFSDGIIPYLIPPFIFFILTMLWCGACRSYCGPRQPSRLIAASQSGCEESIVSQQRPFIFPRYRADGLLETKTTFTQVPLETSQSMTKMSSTHEEVIEKGSVAMVSDVRSVAQASSLVEDEGSVSIVTSSRPMTQVSGVYEEILDSGSISVLTEARPMTQVTAIQEEMLSERSAAGFAAFRPVTPVSALHDEFPSEGSMSVVSSGRAKTQISAIHDDIGMDSSVSVISSSRPMAQMASFEEGFAAQNSIIMGSSISQEVMEGMSFVEEYPVETVIGSSSGMVQDIVEVQQYQSAPIFGDSVILGPTNIVEEDPYLPYM